MNFYQTLTCGVFSDQQPSYFVIDEYEEGPGDREEPGGPVEGVHLEEGVHAGAVDDEGGQQGFEVQAEYQHLVSGENFDKKLNFYTLIVHIALKTLKVDIKKVHLQRSLK